MISNVVIGLVSFTMSNVPTKTSIIMVPKVKFVGEASFLHTIFKMWVQLPYSTLSKPHSSWAWDHDKGIDLFINKMSFILWSLLLHSRPICLIDNHILNFSSHVILENGWVFGVGWYLDGSKQLAPSLSRNLEWRYAFKITPIRCWAFTCSAFRVAFLQVCIATRFVRLSCHVHMPSTSI